MDMFDGVLNSYLERTCDAETDLLRRISRETHIKQTSPHMLSGHYQGRVLAMLSKMMAPQRILEVGTYTGYATICLAEGLSEGGEIHTIDSNAELEDRVSAYFSESGYAGQIHYHIGRAQEVISDLEGPFDLVFIDADKKNNLLYYEMALGKSRQGSLILIDNVLWKGKVVSDERDRQTREIASLNATLAADGRVDKLILPLRDGLFLLRKR